MKAILYRKLLYPLWQLIKKQKINSYLKNFQKTQWKSKSEIESDNWIKIKELIHFCESYVPYYKILFKNLGITGDDIKCYEDYKKIPILTKEIFRKNYDDFIPVNIDYGNYGFTETSGSTGASTKFHISNVAGERWYAAKLFGRIVHGVKLGDPILWIWGRKQKKISFFRKWLKENIESEYRVSAFDITNKKAIQLVKLIKNKKIKSIYGYSSAIYEFANKLNENNISLSLNKIFVTAEGIYDYQKEIICKVFNCSVVSEYGAAEMGILTFECIQGNNHVVEENVYLELLNFEKENNLKKIIITDLYNYAMPLLRYDSGDLTAGYLNEECKCGQNTKILQNIVGRQYDMIRLSNGKIIHGEMINYLVKEVTLKDASYGFIHQFVQNTFNDFSLYLAAPHVSLEKQQIIRTEFIKGFSVYLGDGYSFSLKVIFKDEIKRPTSGKHRYIISNVNQLIKETV